MCLVVKSVIELRAVTNLASVRSHTWVRSAALTAQECLTVWTTESWLSAIMLLWSMTLEAFRSATEIGAELESVAASAEV